jgi:hypothetical protein
MPKKNIMNRQSKSLKKNTCIICIYLLSMDSNNIVNIAIKKMITKHLERKRFVSIKRVVYAWNQST